MDDAIYLLLFLACCGATGALMLLCDRLTPHGEGSKP